MLLISPDTGAVNWWLVVGWLVGRSVGWSVGRLVGWWLLAVGGWWSLVVGREGREEEGRRRPSGYSAKNKKPHVNAGNKFNEMEKT